jgi:hypothetical protein
VRRLPNSPWNLEYLADKDGENCRPAKAGGLQCVEATLTADIISVQELENEQAVGARVLPGALIL